MHQLTLNLENSLIAYLFVVGMLALGTFSQPANADVAGPGWHNVTADPVTYAEAQAYFQTKQPLLSQQVISERVQTEGLIVVSAAVTTQTSEITELARALKNDPMLIYDYVHNHIDYAPYFGALKGATLTYYDQTGNDFDQAALMISLLRASGYTADFVYGQMTIPGAQITNWLDVGASSVNSVLALGGIPVNSTSPDGTSTFDRVWVQANIGGTNYLFDPAFKTYSVKPRVDLASAIGYNRAALLASATTGSTITSISAKNLSESGLASKLTEYSGNLINTIRSQYPNKELDDILGGRDIVQTKLLSYSTTLPFSTSNANVCNDACVSQYAHTLRIRHKGTSANVIDCTINIYDLDGKRLTLTYSGSGGSLVPELRLDGALLPGACTTSTTVPTGGSYAFTIDIDHPYAGAGPGEPAGTFADQTATYKVIPGAKYAVVYNFGSSSKLLLDETKKKLSEALDSGLADDSEAVIGESLYLIGIGWMQEVALSEQIVSKLANTVAITHHRVGLMAQESGYYIDVKNAVSSVLSKQFTSADIEAHAFASAMAASAIEHGILEQMVGTAVPSISTMRLLSHVNPIEEVYYASQANWLSSVRAKLVQGGWAECNTPPAIGFCNCSSTAPQCAINRFDDRFGQEPGLSMVISRKPTYLIGQLTAFGWLEKNAQGENSSISLIVGGLFLGQQLTSLQTTGTAQPQQGATNQPPQEGFVLDVIGGQPVSIQASYYGGYSTAPALIDPSFVYDISRTNLPDLSTNIATQTFKSLDPVDMASGAYLYDHNDLVLTGAMPLGFSRSYNSSKNREQRSLGYGWAHSLDIYLSKSSNPDPGWGGRLPVDAAGSIVALYAAVDLIRSRDDITGWLTTALISNWAVEQVTGNAVTVNIGSQVSEYIRLPDGTYQSPPGNTTQLIDNGNGTFSLLERFGTRYDFNTSDRVSKITDIDGNTINFTYTGNNLTTVTNSFNQSLTLAYSGSNLQSVTDSTSRSISFTYEPDGDLDTYIDSESKVWDYGYDAEHHMTTIYDPTNWIVTNTYDSLGRAATQTVPRQGGGTATYNFYFSGFRNIEEDPNNNQIVYFLDNKGRTVAIQDALGNTAQTEFDGQNHITKTIDARNNATDFTYDANNNLRFINDALSQRTENVYDTLYRLTSTIDPLTNTTQFGYDSEHHLTLTRDALLNSFTSTYFTNGTKQTDTDARNTVTAYSYDGQGNPSTSKVAVHPIIDYAYNARGELQSLTDQNGATTSFLYDKRGLVTEVTDPLLRKTSFVYDAAGRLGTMTDRNLKLTVFGYTPTGKLETIGYATDPTVSFTYDNQDNLNTLTDALGVTQYGYDAVNRLSSQTDPHGFPVGYRYDAAGNLDRLTYPGNKTVTYTYDALNRLKTVTIDWLTGSPTATYVYDAAGRLDYLNQFNGTVTDYTYDAANRLTSLVNRKANGTVISSHQFPILDGNGNRLQEVREEPITPALQTAVVNFSYNTPRNRLISTTNDTFSYDNEGQQTNKSGTLYTFDDAHRLTQIGNNTQFFYDGANNRLKASRNGITTKYIYDAGNNLLAEANNSSQIQRYYIHGAGLLGLVEGNNLYTYHYDATGNTLALTNASENIINTYSYTAYGQIANESETIPQPFKYVGQYGVQYEAQQNVYYMRARYYDPAIGRFISEDPTGFSGGDANLYAYVGGNPISNNDPSGTVCVPCAVIAGQLLIQGARIAAPIIARGAVAGFNAARSFVLANSSAINTIGADAAGVSAVLLADANNASSPSSKIGAIYSLVSKGVTLGVEAGQTFFEPFLSPGSSQSQNPLMSGTIDRSNRSSQPSALGCGGSKCF